MIVGFDYQEIWDDVREAVAGAERIAVNVDTDLVFSDGLNSGEFERLQEALGTEISSKLVFEPELAISFISERSPGMNEVYRNMNILVHEIIKQVFSASVIVPGVTTANVSWAIAERVESAGLVSTFKHSVGLQRQGMGGTQCGDIIIMPGDQLWLDMGVKGSNHGYNLWTDTQHMGYVLREGERDVPEGFKAGMRESNRLQDIQLRVMVRRLFHFSML